jgi:tetratricopeptide (TPR) repeat protein
LSFWPDAEQRLWRTVMRRKYQVTRNRVQLQNRLEALLEEAHIKVSSLVSDLLGISARRMLQALADGETDPAALATLATARLRAGPEQLCDAFQACPTRGTTTEGLAQMSAAADAEDATDKAAISPGPLAPARELYGEMLLDAGKAKEALVAFEATVKKEPNRFRGLYGAAQAAAAAGDKAKATIYYKQLLDLASEGDADRPERQQARKFAR